MKVFIFLSVVAIARSSVIPAPAPVAVAAAPGRLVETGASRVQRTEDNLGNYAFGYDEVHTTGGSFRREQTSPNGGVTGSYGLRDADGRLRTVNYIADEAGFRVAITTNEPGTESKNTAGALYNQGEVPPGPVIDETLLLAPAAPARLVAPPPFAAPVAAPLLAAPAPAAVAPAPAPVAGPFFQAPPSAPVLATPAGATPTVLSNPLLHGHFQQFARPALSTPHALTTAPLAAPLSHFAPAPLAAPALAATAAHGHFAPAPLAAPALAATAAHGHFASAPLAAPALAATATHGHFAPRTFAAPHAHAPIAPAVPLNHGHLFARPAAIAHPAPLPHAHAAVAALPQLVGPAAYAAPAVAPAPAALAGLSYSTQINHAFVPAPGAPIFAGPPAAVKY